MKISKKIESFTLSEVLVVLVVTAIVVAIAFSVLRLTTQQYAAINARYKERAEIQKLEQRLYTDINTMNEVSWNAKERKLLVKNKERSVTYDWTTDYLIRNTDTVSYNTKEIRLFYKGVEVGEGVIDGLEIELLRTGQPIRLFVSRKLDAKEDLEKLWD